MAVSQIKIQGRGLPVDNVATLGSTLSTYALV